MRYISALLVVALALVGFAAAWDSTNYLSYQYQKIVDTQAGEHLDWFGPTVTDPVPDASSSAQFQGLGAYGNEQAFVGNSIQNIRAPLQNAYGTTPDTLDVLTQYGSAVVGTVSPDLQDPCGVIKFGTATAGSNLALSGNYGGGEGKDIQALINNVAEVGVDGVNVVTAPARIDYPVPIGDPQASSNWFSGQIEAEGGYVVDANIGQSATVGFEKINAIGAVPTMSGSVNNWAGFDGAYGLNGAMPTDIEVSVANEQGFAMFGTWQPVTPTFTLPF